MYHLKTEVVDPAAVVDLVVGVNYNPVDKVIGSLIGKPFTVVLLDELEAVAEPLSSYNTHLLHDPEIHRRHTSFYP